jgi:hypothetical protein
MGIKVTLLASPSHPEELIQTIWRTAHDCGPVSMDDPIIDKDLIFKLVREEVPVVRHLKFTFLLEDMPISFREQLVRSQYDDYFIQGGRITDYATQLRVDVPPKVAATPELAQDFDRIVADIKSFARRASTFGLNPSEYRNLVPVGTLHRGIWTTNLQALMVRFHKRTCWNAQTDLWTPVLLQVAKILANEHRAFAGLNLPPCKDHLWKHTGCTVREIMRERYEGIDPQPTCPIWMQHEEHIPHDDADSWAHSKRCIDNLNNLERVWGREWDTGNHIRG